MERVFLGGGGGDNFWFMTSLIREISHGRCWMVIKWAWIGVTSDYFCRWVAKGCLLEWHPKHWGCLSPGRCFYLYMAHLLESTRKTIWKPYMVWRVSIYSLVLLTGSLKKKKKKIFSCSCCQHCIEGSCLLYCFLFYFIR